MKCSKETNINLLLFNLESAKAESDRSNSNCSVWSRSTFDVNIFAPFS